jgi:CRP/FNR family transcriptional regulator, cyclic AMP receptor protein
MNSSTRQRGSPSLWELTEPRSHAPIPQGEHGDEFFVVVRGEVEITSGNRRLEMLGPNSIFGEMALIDDSPRSATVVALTDCTLAPIKENQFLFLVRNTPFFALRVMRVLAARLRRQNKAV